MKARSEGRARGRAGSDREERSPTWTRWSPVLILLVAAAVYANSLDGPFIYDDQAAIVANPTIRQLWPPWPWLAQPPQTSVAGRPVIALSLAANYAAAKLEVRDYHVLNIAVHGLCALLLYGIVRRTLARPALAATFGTHSAGIACVASLLWLVHPVQSECVDYVIQRSESIMALFYLMTLYASIRADFPPRRGWGLVAVVACALGMASKEVMVTAPLVVILHDLVYGERPWRELVRTRAGLWAALAATWGVLALLNASGPRNNTVGFAHGVGALEYAKNQCLMIVTYLRLIVWPHPLVLDYGPTEPVALSDVAPAAAVLALALVAIVVLLRRRPRLGFLGLVFFLILAPTSSIVPIVSEVGAERRLYLALAPVMVLVTVAGFVWLRRRAQRPLKAAAAVAVASVLVLMGWLTRQRNEDYRSHAAIWESAVAARPDNYRALNNLGWVLATDPDPATRQPARAVELLERAARLRGRDDALLLDSLAAAYAADGQFARAAATAGRALAALDSQTAAAAPDIRSRLELYRAGRAYVEAGGH